MTSANGKTVFGFMAPKFGTSGLRGLVSELTPALVQNYTKAFLKSCETGKAIHVGQDLRPSSPEIAGQVLSAIRAAGLTAIDCGAVPTPALAYSAMQQGHGAIMVTGSHIPADRNGLKFYLPTGEISKSDEIAILDALTEDDPNLGQISRAVISHDSITPFIDRYVHAFGKDSLAGLRVGVYQHSSVARDLLETILTELGAIVTRLARSNTFIPVDTEAVDPKTRKLLAKWITDQDLDAVVSTDGDADRPMLAIPPGEVVPGDILGALTAQFLGAEELCTPVSSNTMIDDMTDFTQITRTRIGSPYVIAAMERALEKDPAHKVVGYEANGGFLLGYLAEGPKGMLSPLMTRDCVLPILAPLALAHSGGKKLTELIEDLPQRFTAADRIQGIEADASASFLSEMRSNISSRKMFFENMPDELAVDETDGMRITFKGGDIVHLRPSGNAPEFRCYAESADKARASELVNKHLDALKQRLT